MADSASEFELESDTSSIDGSSVMKTSPHIEIEQLQKQIDCLHQDNKVLNTELDTYKLRCNSFQQENLELRRSSVIIVSYNI